MIETDISSFITGMLAARDQAMAHVVPTPYGLSITYPANAERLPEAVAFRPEGVLDDLDAPFMLHIVDASHAAPAGAMGLKRVLMARPLATAPDPRGDAIEVTDLALMASLNSLPGFARPSMDLRCVQFAALDAAGTPIAAARAAMGENRDVIVDNLVLRAPGDRAGAEAVLATLLRTALARGENRALALVSPEWRGMFDAFGFRPLAQVETFAP